MLLLPNTLPPSIELQYNQSGSQLSELVMEAQHLFKESQGIPKDNGGAPSKNTGGNASFGIYKYSED